MRLATWRKVAATHVGRPDPRAFARGRVPAAGLEKVLLDPVQRRLHRLVVGMHHAAIAMRVAFGRQQRRQGHRLGRREGDVQPRAVFTLAVALAAKADVGADYMTSQQRFELAGGNMKVGPQPQCQRTLAVPEAGVAVFRVLRPPGVAFSAACGVVAAVAAQVVGGGRRGCQVADRGNHGSLSFTATRGTPCPESDRIPCTGEPGVCGTWRMIPLRWRWLMGWS